MQKSWNTSRRAKSRSIVYIVLLLSITLMSSYNIEDVSSTINRGITWFLDSDSKVYAPSSSSWQDVDVSGDTDIPDGATGLVLEIINEDSSSHIGQVRAKGSTDDRTSGAKLRGSTQIMAFVKLDINKVFQAYRDDNNIKFYVRGYTGADVIFFNNWSDVAGGHAPVTTYNVDLDDPPSGPDYDVPPNSIVILELYDHSGTDSNLIFARFLTPLVTRYGQGGTDDAHQFIMVGVDSGSRFQHRRNGNNDYSNFYLVGYIKNVGRWRTSASNDVSGSTTGSWTDIDITAETAIDASVAFFQVQLASLPEPQQADFRKNGSSDNQTKFGNFWEDPIFHETIIFYAVGLDNSQILEINITSSSINIFILGWTIDVSSPNPPQNPLCEGVTNPTHLIQSQLPPTFSWTFDDPDPGDSQSAYQIQVGSTVGDNDLWDSTKVSSASSSVDYNGVPLSVGITYYWRVKTWDSTDLESEYTPNQTFKINQLPTASDLKTEGLTDPENIKSFTPTFSWTYQDPDLDPQSQYEIEVSTDNTFTSVTHWNPPVFSGSENSIQYGGDPLSICTVYHVRVTVYDGYEWSNEWTYGTFQINGATVETSTGSGVAQFDTDVGCLTQLNAVNEETLPDPGKPELDFIHGFFSIEITNLNPGDTVKVSIRLPSSIFKETEYWGYNPSSSTWYQIPMFDNDGDNFIIIQLVEGGLGDDDPTDGVIKMIGGPGQPRLPPVAGLLIPVDKAGIIVTYFSFLISICALIILLSFKIGKIKTRFKEGLVD